MMALLNDANGLPSDDSVIANEISVHQNKLFYRVTSIKKRGFDDEGSEDDVACVPNNEKLERRHFIAFLLFSIVLNI